MIILDDDASESSLARATSTMKLNYLKFAFRMERNKQFAVVRMYFS